MSEAYQRLLRKTSVWAAITLALAFGIFLRFSFLDVPVKHAADEQVYTIYANTLAERGVGGIRELVETYNRDPRRWQYPPPTRVGYLLPLSWFMKVSGIATEEAGALVSRLFSIFSLLVLVLIGMRFFGPWVTLGALWLMSVSPMELMIARRAWQDGVMGFFSSLLIYVSMEINRDPKKKIWYPAFWMLGVLCISMKESGILIYGLCALWIMMSLRREAMPAGRQAMQQDRHSESAIGGRRILPIRSLPDRQAGIRRDLDSRLRGNDNIILFGIFSLLVVVVYYAILAVWSGGPSNLTEVLRHMKETMSSNEYSVRYQEGPWYFLGQGLWILSPVTALLALVGITATLVSRKEEVACGLVFLILAFSVVASAPHYLKNLRYFSVLYVSLYLMSGVGFWAMVSAVKRKLKGWPLKAAVTVMTLVVLWGGWQDYRLFQFCFIQNDVPDLPYSFLLEVAKAKSAQF